MTIEELRSAAAECGYELRKRGSKRDHKAVKDDNGDQLRNCYLPHLCATASVRARTIKVLEDARVTIGCFAGDPTVQWCEIWEVLLLGLEHLVRHLKLKDVAGRRFMEFSLQLIAPLDDWVKVKRVGSETVEGIPDWAMTFIAYGDASGLEFDDLTEARRYVKQLADAGLVLNAPIDETANEFNPHPAFGKATKTHDWIANKYERRFKGGKC